MFNIKEKFQKMKEERVLSSSIYKQQYKEQRKKYIVREAQTRANTDANKPKFNFQGLAKQIGNNIKENQKKPNAFRDSKPRNPFYNE